MNNSSSSKSHGLDQPELSGPTPKSLRTKMGKPEDSEKKVTFLFQIFTITHFLIDQSKNAQMPKTGFGNSYEPQLQDPVLGLICFAKYCFTLYNVFMFLLWRMRVDLC